MDNKLKTIFIYEMKKSINQLVHDHADDVSVGPENLSHSSDGFVVDQEVSFMILMKKPTSFTRLSLGKS